MTDSAYYAGVIEEADFFVDSRRKSEATKVIDRLRNALVRHIGEVEKVRREAAVAALQEAVDYLSIHESAEEISYLEWKIGEIKEGRL